MFINKDSIIINTISMGQYLTKAVYKYPKLWGEDTGRNLKGSFSGALLGVFPKLVITCRKLTQDEVKLLAPVFDASSQSVTYEDPVKGTRTFTSYSGDWEIAYDYIDKSSSNVEISFIDTEPRE